MILRIEQDVVVSIHPSRNTDQGVDCICKCEGDKPECEMKVKSYFSNLVCSTVSSVSAQPLSYIVKARRRSICDRTRKMVNYT